jgi:hypothetical protein
MLIRAGGSTQMTGVASPSRTSTGQAAAILVYDANSMTLRWRTHVPGSVGYSNSIRVADLDGNGLKELYVAGSFGLWRFNVVEGGGNP